MTQFKASDTGLCIRWLIRSDLPEVIEIENRSFPIPWTEDEFIKCISQRNCIACVAESKQSGVIFGYMVYELQKHTINLANVAVAPEVRRSGVGFAMVQRLIDKLTQQRRQAIAAEVSENNLDAQLFFAASGFKARRCVANHYETGGGMIEFVYVLPGTAAEWRGTNRITEYLNDSI